MELKKNFSFRKLFTILYIVAFLSYLVAGLGLPDGTAYTIDGGLAIPSINLVSGVATLELENHKLNTPDTIVGSYTRNTNKTFLIGHSSTIFKNLNQVNTNDSIFYNNVEYKISNIEILKKSDIDMNKILKAEEKDTIIIMTCAGNPVGEKDASHRLIVTAAKE